METVDVKAIQLADPRQKAAIARHAWEKLPPAQRRSDNLAILQEAITHDPPDFVRLCKEAGLPVMVVNVHNETHNHYHGASEAQEGALTAADVLAIVQAAQRPQEASTGVSEMMALMAQQQQRSDALLAAMMAQHQRPQQPTHIEVNPNITVSQTAGEGGGVMIIAGLFFGVIIAVIAGS
jgi:hypothetical protein